MGRGRALRLESRCLLLRGDPRKYYDYLAATPPFSDYHHGKLPAWFQSARMWISDGKAGTGRGLVEDRDEIARDLQPALARLRKDEYLMVFFNHWTTSGDLPYRGTLRYCTYDDKGWSDPVPVEKVRDAIHWLKAIDPRIKVGGYVYLAPAECTPPYRRDEWLMHARDGAWCPPATASAWPPSPISPAVIGPMRWISTPAYDHRLPLRLDPHGYRHSGSHQLEVADHGAVRGLGRVLQGAFGFPCGPRRRAGPERGLHGGPVVARLLSGMPAARPLGGQGLASAGRGRIFRRGPAGRPAGDLVESVLRHQRRLRPAEPVLRHARLDPRLAHLVAELSAEPGLREHHRRDSWT